MINKCIFRDRLPSLNEYISALNKGRNYANTFKQSVESDLLWAIKNSRMKPTDKPCIAHITFHEKNKRRDIDNIYSANKFILDALRKAGIIKNDNQKYITDVRDSFVRDKENFVEIVLEDIEAVRGLEE